MRSFLNLVEPWEKLPDKFDRLNENIIYEGFGFQPVAQKEKIDLILIVSSAPERGDRRDAIRDTWWQLCKSNVRISINSLNKKRTVKRCIS